MMKGIALLVVGAFALIALSGCASSGGSGTGKIGSDYEGNRTYRSNQVQEMHSNIQRGLY
ncbi:MAG: hypothetical protein KDM64_05600 [Verrucomicrobiae bacterium]|nr:hypothetical protein [Verrucomicrobiae bacterium]MCB1090429.1 hypothetical protein [Verrucomicrobiae bacterium]